MAILNDSSISRRLAVDTMSRIHGSACRLSYREKHRGVGQEGSGAPELRDTTPMFNFNMATDDKGRRKWGGISSQDIRDDCRSEKGRSGAMRGAASGRVPPRAIYTPGSGPLKKSGRGPDDYGRDANEQETSRRVSVQDRLKPHFNGLARTEPCGDYDDRGERFSNVGGNLRNDNCSGFDVSVGRMNHLSGDARRRSKKPEQQLSPPPPPQPQAAPVLAPVPLMPPPQQHRHQQHNQQHHQPSSCKDGRWEAPDRDSNNCNWDKQSNRGHRTDVNIGNRCDRRTTDVGNNGRCRPEDQGKRYSGNRKNRPPNENDEREWRSKSPMSGRNFGNRRDFTRDVRQGSEPLSDTPNNVNDYNHRTRDTRSVDPPGYSDKFPRKPPSGRRGGYVDAGCKMLPDSIQKLPPRFQRKFMAKNGLDALPSDGVGINVYGKPNDDWDRCNVNYQGSSDYNNPSYIQNNSLPQSCWSNTIPARSRGRGRLRLEETEAPIMNFRPGTPDQYSAASSRSHTPSLDYTTRSCERRGSNSTMYTSMESLSKVDNVSIPTTQFISSSMIPQSHGNVTTATTSSNHSYNHQGERANNNNNNGNNDKKMVEASASSSGKKDDKCRSESLSPEKGDFSQVTLPDIVSITDLNWYEEVEPIVENDNRRVNAETDGYPSRSSSVVSFRDNGSISGRSGSTIGPSNAGGSRNRGYRKKRRERRRSRAKDGDRSCSRDGGNREKSRERVNNRHNRENDGLENQQKNVNKRYDGVRRYRDGKIYRSRESSRDRDYRAVGSVGSGNACSSVRNNCDENWRTGKRSSMCDSDDSRTSRLSGNNAHNSRNQTHVGVQPFITNENNATTNNSQPPGVIVLPERNAVSPRGIVITGSRDMSQMSQQIGTNLHSQPRKTLYDPNNPGKPIIVRPPGNRGSMHLRDKDNSCQFSSPPSTGNSHPLMSPQLGSTIQNFSNYHGGQMEGVGLASGMMRQSGPFVAEQMQIQANSRPAWYDPCSEILRTAKDQDLLLEIETVDRKLQYLLSSGPLTANWEKISNHRQMLQRSLQTLLETDIKFCQSENVEHHFWKILYYNMIEMLRKMMPKESPEIRESSKQIMLRIIDEGTTYFEKLLITLETRYKFKLEVFLTSSIPTNGLGSVGLALVSAQKIFIFLGDLARYKEQANETTNYGKSRQWYLKAQQINPKNGRPYNQLALLAYYARRKLDAVYYYMRSLMASNPLHSARESLIALFDENRKKYLHYYESTERKRKEQREWKERARMKEKEGSNNAPGAIRRETWVYPGGRRVRRTTSSTTNSDTKFVNSDSEELAQLTSAEVNKRFITSYLHVHGKIITKIGMETFQEAAIQMLREFRTLLQHSPLPIQEMRLLQLLALNMFAIDTTQLKDSQMEQGYRSEVQERALVVSLQMFDLILERGVALLKLQFEENKEHRLIVNEDMQVLLPAIKIWCDWMLCHSTVWNPPPSCTDYRVGPPGDSWSRLATMVNLLEKLSDSRQIVIPAKDAMARKDEVDLIKLPEDTSLSGFTPLMSNPQEPCYADKSEDMEVAQMCLRIQKILFFGEVFLCGLETPVLKLQKNECGLNEYVSVVEASGTSSPSSPPEQSDSELLIESYSEDEDDDGGNSNIQRSPRASWSGNPNSASGAPTGEIRSLIERKEELERRQRKQERHRQQVQEILKKSIVSVDIEVRPRLLVPDTNCFIDYLPQLWSIAKATSGTQPLYTLVIPLVVLNELEGLARGGGSRDCPPASRAALNPEHVARVGESAKAALAFAKSQNPAIKCSTTKGNLLTSSTFTVEEDVTLDGLTRNDDRILATCLSLCKCSNKDTPTADETEPRRLKREVVLLTEDRNLRVKALARDVPVREVPDFMHWAGLG